MSLFRIKIRYILRVKAQGEGLNFILLVSFHEIHIWKGVSWSRGGVLPMWWVIHMCRGFDPLFSLWQDRARSFWGTFSHPPTAKLSFGVQKLPIFTKIDLFGPKFNFFLDLFGSNFQRPAAHPHPFSGRVPPPGLDHYELLYMHLLFFLIYYCLQVLAENALCP